MKTIVVYATPNLMEWGMNVKVGKTTVHVFFQGGQPQQNSGKPAQFRTDNPILQHAIENSPEFKSGRIYRKTEYVAEGESEVKVLSPTPAQESEKGNVESEKRLVKVEVNVLPDAQAYLKENFGIPAMKIKNQEQADRAALQRGVEFVWASKDK